MTITNLNIKFELNKGLDKQMAFVFTNRSEKVGGVDFSKSVTSVHPELDMIQSLSDEDRKETIEKYFDRYYADNRESLEETLSNFVKDWERIEPDFIQQLNTIFKNPTKPEGDWIGFLSIINCNPRFLDNKTFQIFFEHRNGSNSIVIHEVLHFFFYDYAVKNFNNIFKDLDKNKGVFWTLAELFNDVIQNTDEFKKIQGYMEIYGYPDHVKHQEYLKKMWAEDKDIDLWIPKAYDYLDDQAKNI